MQIHGGEVVALTAGDGAAECAAMFFTGVTADSASPQSHWQWIGTPTAHRSASILAVTGVMRSPFGGWTAGIDAPLAFRLRALGRKPLGTQLSRRTEPQRNGRRGKTDPRTVETILASARRWRGPPSSQARSLKPSSP